MPGYPGAAAVEQDRSARARSDRGRWPGRLRGGSGDQGELGAFATRVLMTAWAVWSQTCSCYNRVDGTSLLDGG